MNFDSAVSFTLVNWFGLSRKYIYLCVPTLLLCSFLLTACGGGSDDEQGTTTNLSNSNACNAVGLKAVGLKAVGLKIINGTACSASEQNSSPIVRLTITYQNQSQPGLCTGTAIEPRTILTAAHCVENVFSIDVASTSTTTSVIGLGVHPNYSTQTSSVFNDIAILITENDLRVPVYPLLASRRAITGEPAVIAGFGNDSSMNNGFFQAGNLIVDQVTDNHIITNFNGDTTNPCTGDSGGPILLDQNGSKAIAGVVSFGTNVGNNECGPGDSTFYTSVESSEIVNYIISIAPAVQLL